MRLQPLHILMIAGLVATGACSKKAKDLPPQPPSATQTETQTQTETAATPAVTSSTVPGSLQDMIEQAGSDRVFFAYDSYELDEAARATLSKQATWLGRYSALRVSVEGHADERGTREYNLALGDRRANAVKNYLVGAGVGGSRVSTISYGKERPAVAGSDEESYAQNRRGVTVLSGGAAS